jgi:hypothetical protein
MSSKVVMVDRGERGLVGRTATVAIGELFVIPFLLKEGFSSSTSDPSTLTTGTNKSLLLEAGESLLLEAGVRASSAVGKRQERKFNIVVKKFCKRKRKENT